jgi:hypothetical protein
MLRRQYEKFCEAWKNEKMYQKITLDSGKELPENMQKLGHKPTFKMWTQALKNQKMAAALAPSEKAVEVKDTSWEE